MAPRCVLQGMSEAETSTEVHRFTCQARSHIEGALELRLEGLGRLTGHETFSHELVLPPSKQSALGNALQLTQVAGSPKQPNEPLRCALDDPSMQQAGMHLDNAHSRWIRGCSPMSLAAACLAAPLACPSSNSCALACVP